MVAFTSIQQPLVIAQHGQALSGSGARPRITTNGHKTTLFRYYMTTRIMRYHHEHHGSSSVICTEQAGGCESSCRTCHNMRAPRRGRSTEARLLIRSLKYVPVLLMTMHKLMTTRRLALRVDKACGGHNNFRIVSCMACVASPNWHQSSFIPPWISGEARPQRPYVRLISLESIGMVSLRIVILESRLLRSPQP